MLSNGSIYYELNIASGAGHAEVGGLRPTAPSDF
jgi:hypothetical protein